MPFVQSEFKYVLFFEQVIDHIRAEMKQRHINRLQEGGCTIELGFMYADILSDCERISDHCSNVAVCVIQLHDETFDTHDYLNSVKNDSNGFFKSEYERFLAKYDLN